MELYYKQLQMGLKHVTEKHGKNTTCPDKWTNESLRSHTKWLNIVENQEKKEWQMSKQCHPNGNNKVDKEDHFVDTSFYEKRMQKN